MPPNSSAPIHGASRSGDTRSSHAIGIAKHALISALATNSGIPSGANGCVEKPAAAIRSAVCSSASVASRKNRAARKPERKGRMTFCIGR